MRGAPEYFIAEWLCCTEFRCQLPLRPPQCAMRPNARVPDAIAGALRHGTSRRLNAGPEGEGPMCIVDGIPPEFTRDAPAAGWPLRQLSPPPPPRLAPHQPLL